MKKTYQNPETTVVRIEAPHILAGSEKLKIGDSVTDASGAETRRNYNVWGDDESEGEE